MSLNSSCISLPSVSENDPPDYPIPTFFGFRPSKYFQPQKCDWPPWFDKQQRRPADIRPVRQTVRRNDKQLVCNTLPVISVSNLRSLIPKINNFKTDMLEREVSLALLSEVWEQKNSKKHKFELEKILQLDGLKYISTPRPSKRGGGAAIVANLAQFSLEKMDILIPDKLEVVWGLVKPRGHVTTQIKEIIAVAFYCPPKSRKKSKLMDHLVLTCQSLLTKYPNAGLVIGGDKNEWKIGPLIASLPRLKQIVSLATCNLKTLDVLLTNLWQWYSVPVVVPPVPCDDPTKGVPSDHSTPIAYPLSNTHSVKNVYTTKTARPLPESGITEFGQWITSEEWETVSENISPTEQVSKFQKLMEDKLDNIFPKKIYRVSQQDKPWINFELKKLDRLKKREYRKHGKSDKYLKLLKFFDKKYLAAARDHLDKNVKSLKEENPGQAYAVLKKMGAQPGDCLNEGTFRLTEHVDANLSVAMSAEKIAEHFSSISQEYSPLDVHSLPKYVQDIMEKGHPDNLPTVSELEVYEKIQKAKKPKGGVPGDLPKKLVNEFAPELATPMAKIFQNIIKTQQWPSMWKTELGIPLQKMPNPINEDQLRVISLTPFFSKVFEKFVIEWLIHYIGDRIDWRQYEGQKGSSIAHYLIELINFILYNLDLKERHAVLAVLIDFSKAFNRQDHHILITLLCDLGVPGWLLNIFASFLSG